VQDGGRGESASALAGARRAAWHFKMVELAGRWQPGMGGLRVRTGDPYKEASNAAMAANGPRDEI
jgi:hypothetical protein